MVLIDYLKRTTGIDIRKFFEEALNFLENNHSVLFDYYTNYNTSYPAREFGIYKNIIKELDIILEKLNFYKGVLIKAESWDIIEKVDSLKLKLEEIPSYPRIYKVPFVKTEVDKKYESYILKSHESIEDIAANYNQNLSDLYLINNLREEDYDLKGGKNILLKINKNKANNLIGNVESVCDILIGKNLLGKDLPRYFEIEDNDLKVLSPEQTFLTSVEVLFSLKKGQIPEYPNLGIDKNVIADLKQDGFMFPILLRQLNISLSCDDTIVNFKIDDIDKEEDNYIIKASVQNTLADKLSLDINNF